MAISVDSDTPEYEVKCPQTWAWYAAHIVGFDETNKKFQIKYPDEFSNSLLVIFLSCT